MREKVTNMTMGKQNLYHVFIVCQFLVLSLCVCILYDIQS